MLRRVASNQHFIYRLFFKLPNYFFYALDNLLKEWLADVKEIPFAYLERELIVLHIDFRYLILVESLDNSFYFSLQLILKLLLFLTGEIDVVTPSKANFLQFVDHLLGSRFFLTSFSDEFNFSIFDLQNSPFSHFFSYGEHNSCLAD